MKNRKVYHSRITNIFYVKIDGILYKYPAYEKAHKVWKEAGYTGDTSTFDEVPERELKELKKEKSFNEIKGLT